MCHVLCSDAERGGGKDWEWSALFSEVLPHALLAFVDFVFKLVILQQGRVQKVLISHGVKQTRDVHHLEDGIQ